MTVPGQSLQRPLRFQRFDRVDEPAYLVLLFAAPTAFVVVGVQGFVEHVLCVMKQPGLVLLVETVEQSCS